jgi:hypothetical protein
VLDIIAEFLIDAIGDLFESGAEAAADAAADAVTDVGVDAALDPGLLDPSAAVDTGVLDPGATFTPPVDTGSSSFAFENHPVSPTLRIGGFTGPV